MSRLMLLASTLALTLASSLPVAAATVTTPVTGGNGQAGTMFDVTIGSSALTLQSLGVNVADGPYTYEFWTRSDTVVGHDGSSAGWTLRDTFSNVSGSGYNVLTSFNISDFSVAANSVLGVYFTSTTPSTDIVHYTNGNFVGETIASSADLSIQTGYGNNYAFGDTYAPRNFNGSITYSVGANVPEPASWALMLGGFGLAGVALRRRKATVAA